MDTRTGNEQQRQTNSKGPVIIPPKGTREELIALLQSWREGDHGWDIEEERASFEAFKKGIDENRLPGQKLFE